MRSLGARLALLLVTAIVLVVVTSSLVVTFVMRGPRPEITMEPLARQLQLLAGVAETDRAAALAAGAKFSPAPYDGMREENFSDILTEALRHTGKPREAVISRPPARGQPGNVSLRLDDGSWLLTQMPDFGPPHNGWTLLVGWLTLIVAGSAVVSIFAASKIIRPLRLIEDALGQISPDGALPRVPEAGPSEIKATARALNRLSDRVKAATESRMRLVAAAGHDLRTPMTRMRLRAEFIGNEDERRRWLADLEELDKIADSAIGLVREEITRDPMEKVRLDLIVSSVVEELAAMGLPVSMSKAEPVTIRAAPLALTRALRNLLVNAATHGETATAEVLRRENDIIVKIEDTGPGIPEDRLDQVFEPFFRMEAARQKSVSGAGLGMAIAKEILFRFGGKITVRNRHPKGLEQEIVFAEISARSEIV